MRIGGCVVGPTGDLQLPMAPLGGARHRALDAPLIPDDETAGSATPVSDRKLRRRRALMSLALSVGAWALLGAFAGAAAADDGQQAGQREWSTDAPKDWAHRVQTDDARDDAADEGANPGMTADGSGPTPGATDDDDEISSPPAEEAPASDPQTAPVPADDTTTDDTTTDDTTTVQPAGTSALEPPQTDAGLETAPSPDSADAPVAGPTGTDPMAPAEGLRGPSPDPCGATASPISDPAAVAGAMACEIRPEVDDGDRAGPCGKVGPQRVEPLGAGRPAAADFQNRPTVAEEPGVATAEAAAPPTPPGPDPPAQPIQLPRAPIAPPVLPGTGSAAGGCANPVSAGAQQGAAPPPAIADAGVVVALLPTASNGFMSALTPNVTARAADPGSRPT